MGFHRISNKTADFDGYHSDFNQMIGQSFWVGFDGTVVPAELKKRLALGQVGAVILFSRNLPVVRDNNSSDAQVDLEALAQLIGSLRDAAGDHDLWIAIDHEGGVVQRIKAPATRWPPMMVFSEMKDTMRAKHYAEAVGFAMGQELSAIGIDINFAPVLDIHTNPDNPIIGNRAFGRNATDVCLYASAFAQGLDRAGLLACGKHFPGHGDTTQDSHHCLPYLGLDKTQVQQREAIPFANVQVPMMMTAHILYQALDKNYPVTMSPQILSLLRDEMNYTGLIVSDDLDMQAIADQFPIGDAAIRALDAGCHALLFCQKHESQTIAWNAVYAHAIEHPDFLDNLNKSSKVIMSMKKTYRKRREQCRPSLSVVGCHAHQQLSQQIQQDC